MFETVKLIEWLSKVMLSVFFSDWGCWMQGLFVVPAFLSVASVVLRRIDLGQAVEIDVDDAVKRLAHRAVVETFR